VHSAEAARTIMTYAMNRLTTDLAAAPMAAALETLGVDGQLNAPDLLRTKVLDEEPLNTRLLFEHDYHPGYFRFSNKLLSTYDRVWNSLNLTFEERADAAELFLLHEFAHVPGLSTYNCDLSDGAGGVELAIDYKTDVAAIEAQAALLSFRGKHQADPITLPKLIQNVLSGIQVYDSLDGNAPKEIRAARLNRKLVWHYQYAHAIHQNWTDRFNLQCEPRFGIARSEDGGLTWSDLLARESISPEDLATGLMKVSVYLNSTNHHAVIMGPAIELTVPLIAGIWSGNARYSQTAFRRLFATYPQLVGRSR
jgi:hypothetical protein